MNTPKIVIVGLDSATWDLIGPWAAKGLLPNLSRLIEEGVSGDLESATPPLTPPAWTSFMTGMNPGKHGIYNFLESQPGSYAMRYSNAGSRRSASIWRLLSDAGFSVGSVNVPFTFPPEKCAAFQISGMDTPSENSAFIHPPELRAELERELGKIDLEIRYLGFMSTDDRRDRALTEMQRLDEQWLKMALYLLDKHPVDVMMVTFMSIDTVQHHFWQYMDAEHFLHDPAGAERYGDAILHVYQRLDAAVGAIVDRSPKETTVIVVSDHGGGPVSDRVIFLNRYFAQLGLLKYHETANSTLGKVRQRLLSTVFNMVRHTLSSHQKRSLASVFPALREKFEGAASSFAAIDWSGTKAYCSEVLASPPSVSINLKGARPNGIVEPEEYEALRDLIAAKLAELRDPRDGSLIIPRVYKREELFHGPHTDEAADLILDWWSDKAFQTGTSFPEDVGKPALQIRERAPMKEPEWGGTHRLNGILLMRGSPFKKGVRINGARLVDMAPTLLHLLSQKIPESMDGGVLVDSLESAFAQEHSLQYEKSADLSGNETESSPYSADEAALVEERLKALGYID